LLEIGGSGEMGGAFAGCGELLEIGRNGGGEGLPGAAESSKNIEEMGRKEGLPGAARKWQKLGVGRGCHELPKTGKNKERGGAVVSC